MTASSSGASVGPADVTEAGRSGGAFTAKSTRTPASVLRMTIRQKVPLSWICSTPAPVTGSGLQGVTRRLDMPALGSGEEVEVFGGLEVRCCASKAPPPASKNPLLAGKAKNSRATSCWKADRSGWPPCTRPTPHRAARSGEPTQTGRPSAGQGLPTSQRAARRRRKPGCRRVLPLAARSRIPVPGRPVPASRTCVPAPTSSSAAAAQPPPRRELPLAAAAGPAPIPVSRARPTAQ